MRKTTLNGLLLVLGDEQCGACRYSDFPGQRVKFRSKPCGKCKGTGRRGSGRCRACSDPFEPMPVGHVRDYDAPYPDGPCRSCEGRQYVPANTSSTLPSDVARAAVDAIGVRVFLRQGNLSRGESLLGMLPSAYGAQMLPLWSTTDYGRTFERLAVAWNAGDGDNAARELEVRAEMDVIAAEVAEKVATDRVQACKLFHDDGVLGSQIIVLLSRDGYTVVTASRPDDERAAILAETVVSA